MASAEELYRQMCDGAGPTPDLDPESRRILMLIGALSEAFYRNLNKRLNEPGFSPLEHLRRSPQEYRPESEDEVAIWDELTAPHNYLAVVRYVELRKGKVSEYAAQLHAAILEAARRRWQSDERQASSPATA